MKPFLRYLAPALLALYGNGAHADVVLDVIQGTEIKLQGLLQGDANFFHNDVVDLNGADSNDGKDQEFELRRAEVVLLGKGERLDWQLGYDAKANKYLDVFARYKVGNAFLRAGQYKQFNSLEELTSTRHNDFIAKAMATNLFGVARRLGVSYGVEDANFGYTFGVFGRELTRNLARGSGFGGRAYWAPLNADGQFLHLGLSAVDYDTAADTLRLRVRPDADLATARLIDTGSFLNADRQRTLGLEAAYVKGPLKLQAEYLHSGVQRYASTAAAQSDTTFSADSWYVYGVWNVTGETWTYKAGTPSTPFANGAASGMWQLTARYDSTDLNDDPVFGGEEQNVTVGANWYWRSHFKAQLNYVKAMSEKFNRTLLANVSDDPSIIEARLQFYW
ncbi:MAG: OprO/OprP family phosphate-selective porin [Pseudomarimonas sp.]